MLQPCPCILQENQGQTAMRGSDIPAAPSLPCLPPVLPPPSDLPPPARPSWWGMAWGRQPLMLARPLDQAGAAFHPGHPTCTGAPPQGHREASLPEPGASESRTCSCNWASPRKASRLTPAWCGGPGPPPSARRPRASARPGRPARVGRVSVQPWAEHRLEPHCVQAGEQRGWPHHSPPTDILLLNI